MPATDGKGVLLDVGGVLLPTPWELLEQFEARNGWPPGTLPWRGPLDPATDPLWRSVRAGELTSAAYSTGGRPRSAPCWAGPGAGRRSPGRSSRPR